MFDFVNSEINGVTTYFVNSESVKKNVPFLESKLSNCCTFKGTRKTHFIPSGENIVMNCVSGGSSENLLIQQKVALFVLY